MRKLSANAKCFRAPSKRKVAFKWTSILRPDSCMLFFDLKPEKPYVTSSCLRPERRSFLHKISIKHKKRDSLAPFGRSMERPFIARAAKSSLPAQRDFE